MFISYFHTIPFYSSEGNARDTLIQTVLVYDTYVFIYWTLFSSILLGFVRISWRKIQITLSIITSEYLGILKNAILNNRRQNTHEHWRSITNTSSMVCSSLSTVCQYSNRPATWALNITIMLTFLGCTEVKTDNNSIIKLTF